VLVVANKTDGPRWEAHAYEAAALGFGEPAPVSATSNYLRRAFLDRLYSMLPAPSDAPREDARPAEMRLAIVGRRNAGKSSIVNALAGEDRVIVSEIAGTTRDAVDVRFEFDGRSLIAIDTAGLRKRKALASRVEHWAYQRALESVGRADVVFLVLDALEPISRIDQGLTQEIRERFKPCVIIVNKWDLAEGRPNPKGRPVTTEHYRKYIEDELKGLSRAPIVFTSAVDKRGLRDAVNIGFELFHQSQQRVTTGRLNRLFREIIETRGPSSKLGTIAKVLYVAQLDVAPPTIVLVVNRHELFTPEYRRYLLNRIAEATPFTEVPVRLVIRDRKRADLADLLGRTRPGAPAADATPHAGAAETPAGEDFFDESDLDESFK
jgi:GTP-binding protein